MMNKASIVLTIALALTLGLMPMREAPVPDTNEPPAIEVVEQIAEPEPTEQVMVMEATWYCYGSVTATGTKPIPGRTVATDPRVLPYGTELTIDGVSGYVVEDCGNYWSDEVSRSGYYRHIRGNRIDIFVDSYETAIQNGRREVEVKILN